MSSHKFHECVDDVYSKLENLEKRVDMLENMTKLIVNAPKREIVSKVDHVCEEYCPVNIEKKRSAAI